MKVNITSMPGAVGSCIVSSFSNIYLDHNNLPANNYRVVTAALLHQHFVLQFLTIWQIINKKVYVWMQDSRYPLEGYVWAG